ncbi:MAG: 5'/3'-nucleotidase SurE [Hyphomicrobiales bacterium]|uniref:5'/3'-nucleotidase SurE n=1 Tax=Rhabdaerophilum calidifontis TaxID=2604328 RepID=UPI00123B2B08|nr:5'/3'-nucleotidase SurE [Rhabdaerophilum calidifontis]MCA1952849.1 5'/3'-nucleotidase SurE [Hyphomicrobiales bacterium]MCA1999773.1 5'/3'-nucleotidase SurE [Hyphomicrobiales bacterium]
MKILVTNDDGIHAPGLRVLEAIARQLSDDVHIVAPETDQSGVSHSLSLNDPLRLRQVGEGHYAVKGTPTDCVIMGVRHLLRDNPPDLVLSGVNRGQNVAEDVTYSGTIAAAMEGTILGIPSIALSQAYQFGSHEGVDWSCAEAHGAPTIRRILEIGVPRGIVMNVNFPARKPEEVKGYAVSVQGQRNQALLNVDKRQDGRGNPYYWIAFARGRETPPEGTDLHALVEGRIAVTPLRLDLTDFPNLTRFAEALGG